MSTLIERVTGTLESPIEDEFMHALASIAGEELVVVAVDDVKQMGNWALREPQPGRVFVCLQAPVGRYRCDFLLMAQDDHRNLIVLCVECDGHEYHKLTPKQIDRDLRRDQWFARHCIETLRFTGRMLTRDPYKCAHRALRKVRGKPDTGASFHDDGKVRLGTNYTGINDRSQPYSNRENFPFLGDDA